MFLSNGVPSGRRRVCTNPGRTNQKGHHSRHSKIWRRSAGLLPLPDRRGKVISAPLDAVIRQGLCERTAQFHNTAEPILVALRAFWEPSFFSSFSLFFPRQVLERSYFSLRRGSSVAMHSP
jgi:hypothetical protein